MREGRHGPICTQLFGATALCVPRPARALGAGDPPKPSTRARHPACSSPRAKNALVVQDAVEHDAPMRIGSAAYPFPYFGAGEQDVWELVCVFVRLQAPPSADAIRRITELAPPPLRSSCGAFRVTERFAMVFNDEVELLDEIRASYGVPGASSAGDERLLPGERVRFGEAIEAWLRAIHALCPIEFAFRQPDGTAEFDDRFSSWHFASGDHLPALLERWDADEGFPPGGQSITSKKKLMKLSVYRLLCLFPAHKQSEQIGAFYLKYLEGYEWL